VSPSTTRVQKVLSLAAGVSKMVKSYRNEVTVAGERARKRVEKIK